MDFKSSKQILGQVVEPLARSAVMPHDAAILAYQLLAWAEQTRRERLGALDGIEAALGSGASGLTEGLERLAKSGGALGQAFNNAAVVARSTGPHVVEAAAAAKRLVDAGVFERFYPADVAAELMPWVPGYELLSPQVLDILSGLTFLDQAKTIYCPWEFSGQFLGKTLGVEARVHAESTLPFPLPALVSLFREGETSVQVTDPLRDPSAVKDGRLEKFEATIAFPPLSFKTDSDVVARDIYNRFVVPKATSTGLMIQHVVAQTDGRAAVVVPASFLSGPGTDKDVRKQLLEKGQVRGVIALPSGILPNSNMPIAILMLGSEDASETIRFVDATQPIFRKMLPKGRTEIRDIWEIIDYCVWPDEMHEDMPDRFDHFDSSMAARVPVQKALANDALLQVDRYVMPIERRRLQALLQAAPSRELGEYVDFVTPLPNKDRGAGVKNGMEVLEVGAADLPPVAYIQTPSKRIMVRLPKKARSEAGDVFLRPFDVVLIIKGSVGKIGVVPEHVPSPGEGGWIAGQSATVIRAKDGDSDLRPLALMLRSKIGQELLASIYSGATIPMISLSSLKQLAVPTLPEELARSATEVLDLEEQMQTTIDDLKREQAELAESLWEGFLPDPELV